MDVLAEPFVTPTPGGLRTSAASVECRDQQVQFPAYGLEVLLGAAADAGTTYALAELAVRRGVSGDRDGAERIACQATDAVNARGLTALARRRKAAGARRGQELLRPFGLEPDGTPSVQG